MIKVSNRLKELANLVPIDSRLLDVGCDHGLLDIYLYENKKCDKIIASDINENALNNAIENIKKANLSTKIECRLGNGLDVISKKDMIDTIVISGMGSLTILEIIRKNIDLLSTIQTLIIQSNTNLELLRRNICKYGFKIIDEIITLDNKKYYTIIKFIKGKEKYNYIDYFIGPKLKNKDSDIFEEYCKLELKKLYLILKLLPFFKLKDRCRIRKQINAYKKCI